MTEYRSTTLRLVERHCPKALQLYEEGHRGDMSATEAGTAAHVLLHRAGMEADRLKRGLKDPERHDLAREVMVELTTQGRSFDDVPEPPLSLPAVQAGLSLAMEWLAEHGELPGDYELPLAITKDGKAAPYGPGAWYRQILDHSSIEDGLQVVRVLRDYKSFWSAGRRELDGIQMHGQAVLAYANGLCEGCDELRLEIANLQTRTVVSESIYLRHETGPQQLHRWRMDLVRWIEGLERQRGPNGELPASPGPKCYGCPFIGICEAAGGYLKSEGLPATKEERARLLAVLEARRTQVRAACEADTHTFPVEVEGQVLGHHLEEIRVPAEMAGHDLAREWTQRNGDLPGLLYAMKLTGANLAGVARALFPKDRDSQDAWLEPLLREKGRERFGWRDLSDVALLGPGSEAEP